MARMEDGNLILPRLKNLRLTPSGDAKETTFHPVSLEVIETHSKESEGYPMLISVSDIHVGEDS